MAVQAQYPSYALSPLDFRPRLDGLEEIQIFNNGGGAKSDLTCIASVPKKRAREETSSMALSQVPSKITETSTSGRAAAVSHLYHQCGEIDALVRLHTDRLRSGLEESRKRHCGALLSIMEQQTAKRLKEKEMELQKLNQRNVELEEKVKQMVAESQIWFSIAKNNDAVVSSLKATLEQVLLGGAAAAPAMEGYGDSEDAESCCFEGDDGKGAVAIWRENEELRRRRSCRSCGAGEVCVLLLPCKHLCLCKECESGVDTCPVCHATKTACLQISMS